MPNETIALELDDDDGDGHEKFKELTYTRKLLEWIV